MVMILMTSTKSCILFGNMYSASVAYVTIRPILVSIELREQKMLVEAMGSCV